MQSATVVQSSPSVGVAELTAGNQTLQERIAAAEAGGQKPPRLSDPAAAPVVKAAFDVQALSALQFDGVGRATSFCRSIGKSMLAYTMFGGTHLSATASDNEKARQLLELESTNFIEYQDEVTLALEANLVCAAKLAPLIEAVWKTLPPKELTGTRKQGLLQARRGAVDMLVGAARTQSDPLRPENRHALLQATIKFAAPLVSLLTPNDRAKVVAGINEEAALPGIDATSRSMLMQLREIVSTAPCDGLCTADLR